MFCFVKNLGSLWKNPAKTKRVRDGGIVLRDHLRILLYDLFNREEVSDFQYLTANV